MNHSMSIINNQLSNGYMSELIKATKDEKKPTVNNGYGSISKPKGLFEPDDRYFQFGTNARGIRERFYTLSFSILREISRKVAVITSIQNLRTMQIRPFSVISHNEDDLGFMVKLKDKDATPTSKQKKEMKEIEEFVLYSGYTNFNDPEIEDREGMEEINEYLIRELLTIDQVAISLRRNRSGKLIDYWLLDAATIKRTVKGRGFDGNKQIKFVQEIDSRIIDTFTNDDIVFYYANRRADITKRGYGYSYLEMAMDVITSWLFGMSYNKEFFNTSSMPKGIISFEDGKLNQSEIEELQRQWISMFKGIKGMWKTPFLQYAAKWQNISPSNRDMEFNQYIQMLAAWICAIHGTDAQELGMRFNQAQNVLNDNQEAKIAYSKDRGLRHLLTSISTVYNKIICKVPEWNEYYLCFTGLEAKDQKSTMDVDKTQVETYMTLNEKRAEKDLKPVDGGDVVLNPQFIQLQQQQMMQEGMGEEGEGLEDEGDITPEEIFSETGTPAESEDVNKSEEDDFVEIIL